MKKYLAVLSKASLFKQMTHEEIEQALRIIGYQIKTYLPNQSILNVGDSIASFGIVLQGGIVISNNDYWGNQNIINKLSQGSLFAESYALIPEMPIAVDVVAEGDTQVLWLLVDKLLNGKVTDNWHTQVIDNLIRNIASKNIFLNKKISHLSKRTTREKLFSYLSDEALRQAMSQFEIKYNRQQLANYLSVDRSALSSELSKLQSEGYIKYKKNKFELLNRDVDLV